MYLSSRTDSPGVSPTSPYVFRSHGSAAGSRGITAWTDAARPLVAAALLSDPSSRVPAAGNYWTPFRGRRLQWFLAYGTYRYLLAMVVVMGLSFETLSGT